MMGNREIHVVHQLTVPLTDWRHTLCDIDTARSNEAIHLELSPPGRSTTLPYLKYTVKSRNKEDITGKNARPLLLIDFVSAYSEVESGVVCC